MSPSNARNRVVVAMMSITLACSVPLPAQTTRPIGDGELTIEFPAGWNETEVLGRKCMVDPSQRAFIALWSVHKENLAEMTPLDYAKRSIAWLEARANDSDRSDPVAIENDRFPGVEIEVRLVIDKTRWTYVYFVLESQESLNVILLMAPPSSVDIGREAITKMIASIREKEESSSAPRK